VFIAVIDHPSLPGRETEHPPAPAQAPAPNTIMHHHHHYQDNTWVNFG